MSQPIHRRAVLGGALTAFAAPLIIGRRASADDKSITVGIYTGQQGDVVRKQIIPPFEAKHGCKVYTTQGVTLEQIALMRSSRDNPKYSVMFIDDIGVELAKPVDFQVARVASAMRARQHGGVAEGAKAVLVLHAAHHAGHPEAGSSRRQRGGELAGDLVHDGDDNGPRAGEAQPGDARTERREHLVLRPVPGATRQSGRLSAVLELQHLRGPERAEVYQFSRGQHVRVGCEGGRPAPPCRIDLGKQENPDERRQVASRAARIGLVVTEFADKAGSGGIRPAVEVREHGADLRLPDAPGDNSLDR